MNPGTQAGNILLGTILIVACGVIYFLPVWLALLRKSRFVAAISVLTVVSVPLDFIVGFGVVVWLASLIWAIASGPAPKPVQVIVNQANPPPFSGRPPPLPTPVASVGDELSKLVSLRDSGELSAAEFERLRSRVLR